MAVKLNPNRKPVVVIEPDMRFATTFLSTKYRDYAVNGEAIMDKTTGELFLKRPSDGKILSFTQNNKMLHDLAMELRVLTVNNPEFQYPKENENAFYVYTNYDLVAMRNELILDMCEEDVNLVPDKDQEVTSINTMKFKVSGKSNGFFINHGTRYSDRPFVSYMNTIYNSILENYNGNDTEASAEQKKFTTEKNWKQSTYSISLTVTAHKDKTSKAFEVKENLCLNETCLVLFPEEIKTSFTSGVDYYDITVKEFKYDKLRYIASHKDKDPIKGNIPSYDKLICADKRVEPSVVTIMSFLDNAEQITIAGNELILAFMDVPYINRYMGQMANIKSAGDFITSTKRPDSTLWSANGIWAEEIREVKENGMLSYNNTETNLQELQMYFANAGEVVPTMLKTNDAILTDLLFVPEEG